LPDVSEFARKLAVTSIHFHASREAVAAPPARPAPATWDDHISELGNRHYNRFSLYSKEVGSVRSQQNLRIQQLGCVRTGWPADVNEKDAKDVFEDNDLHSHGTDGSDVDGGEECRSRELISIDIFLFFFPFPR
jgi:hypothetical protein